MRRMLLHVLSNTAGPRSIATLSEEDASNAKTAPDAQMQPPPNTPIATTKWQQQMADAPDGRPTESALFRLRPSPSFTFDGGPANPLLLSQSRLS